LLPDSRCECPFAQPCLDDGKISEQGNICAKRFGSRGDIREKLIAKAIEERATAARQTRATDAAIRGISLECDETGFFQRAEAAGDGRLAGADRFNQLSYGELAAAFIDSDEQRHLRSLHGEPTARNDLRHAGLQLLAETLQTSSERQIAEAYNGILAGNVHNMLCIYQ
jgi:hypothetical protein